jgi:hypothetical protein
MFPSRQPECAFEVPFGVLAVCIFAAVGCGADEPKEPRPNIELKYESAHYRVGTSFSEPLCSGTLTILEKHAESLRDLLGTELAPVDIYLYDASAPCAESDTAGCYDPDSRFIKTDWASTKHEIVHALTYQWGLADPLFTEGTAEAFDGAPSEFKDILPSSNFGHGVDYAAARHFVRWLFASKGLEPLREVFRRSEPSNGTAVFQSVYGTTLNAADTEYFADAMDLYPGFEDCASEPLPWQGDSWTQELVLDCASEDTWGWGFMLRDATFDVTKPGRYFLQLEPAGAEALVTRCEIAERPPGDAPNPDRAGREWRPGHRSDELELAPGRYQIQVRVPAGAPVTLLARLSLDLAFQPLD